MNLDGYKLAPLDDKIRKLGHVRKLWESVLDMTNMLDVFKNEPIKKEAYDVDHFIPWSFVMNDELWNLMSMDSSLNSSKRNRLPQWDKFFMRFAQNQYVMYELVHKKAVIRKLYESAIEIIFILFGQVRNCIEKEIQEKNSMEY